MKNKHTANYIGIVMLILFIIGYAIILFNGYNLQLQRWIKFLGTACYLVIMSACLLYSPN